MSNAHEMKIQNGLIAEPFIECSCGWSHKAKSWEDVALDFDQHLDETESELPKHDRTVEQSTALICAKIAMEAGTNWDADAEIRKRFGLPERKGSN